MLFFIYITEISYVLEYIPYVCIKTVVERIRFYHKNDFAVSIESQHLESVELPHGRTVTWDARTDFSFNRKVDEVDWEDFGKINKCTFSISNALPDTLPNLKKFNEIYKVDKTISWEDYMDKIKDILDYFSLDYEYQLEIGYPLDERLNIKRIIDLLMKNNSKDNKILFIDFKTEDNNNKFVESMVSVVERIESIHPNDIACSMYYIDEDMDTMRTRSIYTPIFEWCNVQNIGIKDAIDKEDINVVNRCIIGVSNAIVSSVGDTWPTKDSIVDEEELEDEEEYN